MTRLLRLLTCTLLLCLSSCIDGTEEIWIHADGSSKIELRYHIPSAARRKVESETKLMQEIAKDCPGVHWQGPDFTEDATGLLLRCQVGFDSPRAAARFHEKLISSQAEATTSTSRSLSDKLAGNTEVQFRGLAAHITRQVDTHELLPLSNHNAAARARNAQLLKGAKLSYILHLPNPPLDSNAHHIEDEGKTLRWDFPLIDSLDQAAELRVSWRPSIPWWIWLILAGILTGAFLFSRWFLRHFKKKHRSSAPEPSQ